MNPHANKVIRLKKTSFISLVFLKFKMILQVDPLREDFLVLIFRLFDFVFLFCKIKITNRFLMSLK